MHAMGTERLALRDDPVRRLRNALLSLSHLDPRWMLWVEREIDTETMDGMEIVRLVEQRARALLLGRHGFFGSPKIGHMIFREDWPFTDDGDLTAG